MLAPQVRHQRRSKIFESDASVSTRMALEDHFLDAIFGEVDLGVQDKSFEFIAGDESGVAGVELLEGSDKDQGSIHMQHR